MCLDLIRIAASFVSFSFPFFPFSYYFQWTLNAITFWSKSKFDYESSSEFHLFHVWFVVSSSFVSFFCSFLPFFFFFSIVLFVLRSSFLSFLDHQNVFQFSRNLSDNLVITFCWKRDPGGGIDSFDPNKKKGSTKKWTGSQHYATTLYWDLGSLMHFFIATKASFLEPLVFIKYCLSSSETRS